MRFLVVAAAIAAACIAAPAAAMAGGTGGPTRLLIPPPPPPAPASSDLDRVAAAVEEVESNQGRNPAMWRPDPFGPQGPMQVSLRAALDVGGGNRFDAGENRVIGRLYLSLMYRRYGNWPDALAAYNWGPGNMDLWIKSGRPEQLRPVNVLAYQDRVLRMSSGSSGATPPLAAILRVAASAPLLGPMRNTRLRRDLAAPLLLVRSRLMSRPGRIPVADADFRRWRTAVSAAFKRLSAGRQISDN
ncbi:MAG TPA: transglycosylase SLT domain-containing protein [Stellaceae bacterium]|nr:transglycosylase SLT domain-containing protein [Stellaceae bacterium]